jgi:hypothetical protein
VLSLFDDPLTRRRMLAAGAAAFVSMHEVKERLGCLVGWTPILLRPGHRERADLRRGRWKLKVVRGGGGRLRRSTEARYVERRLRPAAWGRCFPPGRP